MSWLTVAEALERIRAKDPRVIRSAIRSGELPASVLGSHQIRIHADDLDAWLRSRSYLDKEDR